MRDCRISQRIGEALTAKKARGEAVGNAAGLQPFKGTRAQQAAEFAAKLRPALDAYRGHGLTRRRAMVEALNGAGTRTANGGAWSLVQLQRVIGRLDAAGQAATS